jgi:hypothetical protein
MRDAFFSLFLFVLLFLSGQPEKPSLYYAGEYQRLIKETQREALSVHRFTFKVDPFLGYVVEARCLLQTDDSSNTQVELMNFMPRDAVKVGRQITNH